MLWNNNKNKHKQKERYEKDTRAISESIELTDGEQK